MRYLLPLLSATLAVVIFTHSPVYAVPIDVIQVQPDVKSKSEVASEENIQGAESQEHAKLDEMDQPIKETEEEASETVSTPKETEDEQEPVQETSQGEQEEVQMNTQESLEQVHGMNEDSQEQVQKHKQEDQKPAGDIDQVEDNTVEVLEEAQGSTSQVQKDNQEQVAEEVQTHSQDTEGGKDEEALKVQEKAQELTVDAAPKPQLYSQERQNNVQEQNVNKIVQDNNNQVVEEVEGSPEVSEVQAEKQNGGKKDPEEVQEKVAEENGKEIQNDGHEQAQQTKDNEQNEASKECLDAVIEENQEQIVKTEESNSGEEAKTQKEVNMPIQVEEGINNVGGQQVLFHGEENAGDEVNGESEQPLVDTLAGIDPRGDISNAVEQETASVNEESDESEDDIPMDKVAQAENHFDGEVEGEDGVEPVVQNDILVEAREAIVQKGVPEIIRVMEPVVIPDDESVNGEHGMQGEIEIKDHRGGEDPSSKVEGGAVAVKENNQEAQGQITQQNVDLQNQDQGINTEEKPIVNDGSAQEDQGAAQAQVEVGQELQKVLEHAEENIQVDGSSKVAQQVHEEKSSSEKVEGHVEKEDIEEQAQESTNVVNNITPAEIRRITDDSSLNTIGAVEQDIPEELPQTDSVAAIDEVIAVNDDLQLNKEGIVVPTDTQMTEDNKKGVTVPEGSGEVNNEKEQDQEAVRHDLYLLVDVPEPIVTNVDSTAIRNSENVPYAHELEDNNAHGLQVKVDIPFMFGGDVLAASPFSNFKDEEANGLISSMNNSPISGKNIAKTENEELSSAESPVEVLENKVNLQTVNDLAIAEGNDEPAQISISRNSDQSEGQSAVQEILNEDTNTVDKETSNTFAAESREGLLHPAADDTIVAYVNGKLNGDVIESSPIEIVVNGIGASVPEAEGATKGQEQATNTEEQSGKLAQEDTMSQNQLLLNEGIVDQDNVGPENPLVEEELAEKEGLNKEQIEGASEEAGLSEMDNAKEVTEVLAGEKEADSITNEESPSEPFANEIQSSGDSGVNLYAFPGSPEDITADNYFLIAGRTNTVTVTRTVATVTANLLTFSSCYETAVAMPLCSSSVLSRRKRRLQLIEEKPLLKVEGGIIPFRTLIRATKASQYPQRQAKELADPDLDLDLDLDLEASARLISFEMTSTVSLTSTVTSTAVANGYETLRFTSDAANPGCLPQAFLAANHVNEC